jgi:hypothetical protein
MLSYLRRRNKFQDIDIDIDIAATKIKEPPQQQNN